MKAQKSPIFRDLPVPKNTYVTCPHEAYKLVAPYLEPLRQEVFLVLALNTRSRAISLHTVSAGLLDSSLVGPREVFRRLIEKSAFSAIIAHNHPSGDSTPSSNDHAATRTIQKAGDIIGIAIRDHLIVGDNEFYSFADKRSSYFEEGSTILRSEEIAHDMAVARIVSENEATYKTYLKEALESYRR